MKFVSPTWHHNIGELFDAVPMLVSQSVTAVEIICGVGSLDYVDAVEIERLKRALVSAGVSVNSVHAPFGSQIDISSFDDNIHEQGVASVIKAIEFTRALDARFTIVHAGDGNVQVDRDKRLARASGIIRELAALAEDAEVVLAVENLPPGYISGIAEEMLSILRAARSSNIGICFDTGHANLGGRFEETARQLLPYAVTAHIHDNDGTEDQHLFPGQGTIDWRLFSNLVQEYSPGIPLMIECRPPDGWDWARAHLELGKLLSAR